MRSGPPNVVSTTWMTLVDVQDHLDLDRDDVLALIHTGELPAMESAQGWVVRGGDFEAWVEQKYAEARAHARTSPASEST